MAYGASRRPPRCVAPLDTSVERLAELVVGVGARRRPAVGDLGHAGSGEGVGDAVAEVVRGGREDPWIADVQHAEVAEVVGGDAWAEQRHHRRPRREPRSRR